MEVNACCCFGMFLVHRICECVNSLMCYIWTKLSEHIFSSVFLSGACCLDYDSIAYLLESFRIPCGCFTSLLLSMANIYFLPVLLWLGLWKMLTKIWFQLLIQLQLSFLTFVLVLTNKLVHEERGFVDMAFLKFTYVK